MMIEARWPNVVVGQDEDVGAAQMASDAWRKVTNGSASFAVRIFRRRAEAPPRLRRGYSVDIPWIFRGDGVAAPAPAPRGSSRGEPAQASKRVKRPSLAKIDWSDEQMLDMQQKILAHPAELEDFSAYMIARRRRPSRPRRATRTVRGRVAATPRRRRGSSESSAALGRSADDPRRARERRAETTAAPPPPRAPNGATSPS